MLALTMPTSAIVFSSSPTCISLPSPPSVNSLDRLQPAVVNAELPTLRKPRRATFRVSRLAFRNSRLAFRVSRFQKMGGARYTQYPIHHNRVHKIFREHVAPSAISLGPRPFPRMRKNLKRGATVGMLARLEIT